MRVLSLFSGIGMLDHGVDMGLGYPVTHTLACDIDPYARYVLANSPAHPTLFGDVTALHVDEQYDIVTAGSPCQDFSIGNRNATGITGERSSLVVEVPRLAVEAQAHTIVVENVCQGRKPILNLLRGALPTWKWGTITISSSAVNRPHLRRRALIMGSRKFAVKANPEPLREAAEPLLPTPCATDWKGGYPRLGGMPTAEPERLRRFREELGCFYPPMYVEGPRGGVRVNPEFTEALMGIPYGWVTRHSNIPWADQLRLIGNSCDPLAVMYGIRRLIGENN